MKRNRSAKILATLGPATSSPEMLERLVLAGADVVRMNFSHGSYDDHRANYDVVRSLERKLGTPIGILMDLQGPKLRVGAFEKGRILLETGATFHLDMDPDLGTDQRVELPHPEIFRALTEGSDLLLDDGKLHLRVEEVTAKSIVTRVIVGGVLSDRKGLNVPNTTLPISAMTAKDRADLVFGLDLGVDWVALSFVQRPDDVAELRELIDGRASIISKLEKPAAFDQLEDIIDLSDAIMIARGDLGVEVPPERVPILQKQVLQACHQAGRPVVVATQMLESMVNAPTPTRAEASDVATAIYDGADAVMLSAETAVGKFPVEAVAIMDRIIKQVETDEYYRHLRANRREIPEDTDADAIAAAASQVAETLKASLIVAYTTSGSTAIRVSRQRPVVPILCLTVHQAVARRMKLVWGIHPVIVGRDIQSFSEMIDVANCVVLREKFGTAGEPIVVTAGVPFGYAGSTNTLRIAKVRDTGEGCSVLAQPDATDPCALSSRGADTAHHPAP
ncbi:pyruvate kinase [Phaeovibrio sulfidiphilus]|uniref:Pyruvate kinase n=1 Tax=Phaeovibrio sulfidiphilus TaxID=1220600 RepID=A0A8J7CW61_9PROT|nr:pyruvate kinase [Phaeovibrio sulfidiphilus]MBE1237111.1 pyruvate kinase [Phaeovibrio sulfidiphilus]